MEAWEEQDDWFNLWFELFWLTYDGKKLCESSVKKGSKEAAKAKAKVHIKSKQKAKEVIEALRAQIKAHMIAKGKGGFTPNFPMVTTWINQKRWTCEIEQAATLIDSPAHHQQKCIKCDREVYGPAFNTCLEHRPANEKFKQEVIESLKKKNLMKTKSQSVDEWREQLKGFCRENFGRIGKRI